MARHHYRDAWSHNLEELEDADRLAQKLQDALSVRGGDLAPVDEQPELNNFVTAMEDDLDTPSAIVHLENLADSILDAADGGSDVESAQTTLRSMSTVFGLHPDTEEPGENIIGPWSRHEQDFT